MSRRAVSPGAPVAAARPALCARPRHTSAILRRRPARLALRLTLLAGLATTLVAPVAHAKKKQTGPGRIELPQVRVNAVDVRQWPKVRILASLLGRGTRPLKLDALRLLEVRSGKSTAGPPLAAFKDGKLVKNSDLEATQAREGKLWVASKAGVASSAVIVVVGHEHPALKRGSLGPQLREAVTLLLKQFGKTDRVNVLWAGDRIRAAVKLASLDGELQDLESTTVRTKCAQARADAVAGGAVELGPKGKEFEPGTDLCGLHADAGGLADIVGDRALTSFRGKFPRLFNLGKPFYDPTRYCDIPTDRLEGFGDGSLMPNDKNFKRTIRDREERAESGERLDFNTSAMDEALRILLRDSNDGENKALILISDGHDGYLDDIDLCKRRPPRRCREVKGSRRRKCVKAALDKRITLEQAMFAAKAKKWIGLARAAGIKVYSLGIGPLARPDELLRLRILAEKTGGTYRVARTEARLAQKIGDLGNELLGQVVIDFTHPAPDEVADKAGFRIQVKGADEKGRRIEKASKVMKTRVPEQHGWKQMVKDGVIDALVSAQEALGYDVYVIVGIAILVVVGLIALLIFFLVVRGFFRLLGRIFRRGGEE